MMQPEFTLGHENSGWVEEVGEGVTGFTKGDAYLVYGPIGCGHCAACSRGQDTYCDNVATMPYLASGLGRDGGMAEYLVVPARNLVPLGDADPIDAAPLSDAGLTPYHAIKLALPKLAGGGKTALVIGLGGLGQVAVQILRAISGATVIATDMKPEAMAEAEPNGAVTVPGGEGQVERIRELTNTYWGTIEELYEVAELYRNGQIKPEVKRYAMADALQAYHDLHDGKLSGRAVVVPH